MLTYNRLGSKLDALAYRLENSNGEILIINVAWDMSL